MGAPAAASPTGRKTKVAVLIDNLEVGGAEQDIVRNFPRLNRDEFEVVVMLFGYRGALVPELERQGIRVLARLAEPTPATGTLGRLARILASLLWVGRTFRRERIDIAHCYLPHSYAYGVVACALWRPTAKTVMSRLSLNFYRRSHRQIAWMERHALHSRVDIAIGNSKLIVDELIAEGVHPSKVRLLYNGINLAPFTRSEGARERAREDLRIDQDAFVMVAVGNLHTYKGHRDLIEACAMAREKLPERWMLLIAGRDQEGNHAAYEALIAERGLTGHVQLLGPRDDIPTLLFAADVFVQPSHHEGLPNSVIEAMAASLPVIGTRVGGIPEAVRAAGDTGDTGWLVPPQDSEALASALFEASGDQERRTAMGESARAAAEVGFSLARSVRDYEAIYRELLP